MTLEQWERIDQLIQAALDMTETQRVMYLSEACADDPSLKREVEVLLSLESWTSVDRKSPMEKLSVQEARYDSSSTRYR